jgi:hypothetical protein
MRSTSGIDADSNMAGRRDALRRLSPRTRNHDQTSEEQDPVNDFLDRLTFTSLATSLLVPPKRCEIRCDTDSCSAVITVSHDIDEAQSAAIVRAAGWQAKQGVHRFAHHCQRHAERGEL